MVFHVQKLQWFGAIKQMVGAIKQMVGVIKHPNTTKHPNMG